MNKRSYAIFINFSFFHYLSFLLTVDCIISSKFLNKNKLIKLCLRDKGLNVNFWKIWIGGLWLTATASPRRAWLSIQWLKKRQSWENQSITVLSRYTVAICCETWLLCCPKWIELLFSIVDGWLLRVKY